MDGGFYEARSAPDAGVDRGTADPGVEVERLLARYREAMARRPEDLKSLAGIMAQIERASARLRAEQGARKGQRKLAENISDVLKDVADIMYGPDGPPEHEVEGGDGVPGAGVGEGESTAP